MAFVVAHVRHVLFEFRAQFDHLRLLLVCHIPHGLHRLVVRFKAAFIHIGDVNDRFARQELHFLVQTSKGVVILLRKRRDGLFGIEMRLQGLSHIKERLSLFVALDLPGKALDFAFQLLQVGQSQFRVDNFNIQPRIECLTHVGDIGVLKAANHMHDGRRIANVAQKLIAESFPVTGAFHQSGDIHEFNGGMNRLSDFGEFGEFFNPRVRNGDDGFVRLHGAKRITRHLRVLFFDERIKRGTFADVG